MRTPEEIGRIVLERLQRRGQELYQEIQDLKEQRSKRRKDMPLDGKASKAKKALAKR